MRNYSALCLNWQKKAEREEKIKRERNDVFRREKWFLLKKKAENLERSNNEWKSMFNS